MTPITSPTIQETNSNAGASTASAFKRRVIFAVAAGWGNKGVSILVNLIQIPLLFRYLDKEVLGVWFLMIGAQALIGLFDLGFGQTLQRRLAFAKGACGSSPDVSLDESARQKIRDLMAISRRVYSILSGVVLLSLLIGGPLYFKTLDLTTVAAKSLHIAWIIMAVGYAANMWGWYVEATLNGLGDIGYSNVINSVLWIVVLVATWIVLASGGGLPYLAFIWILRGVLLRLFGWMVIRQRHPWIRIEKGKWLANEFRTMVRPAMQWWIAIVGTFFLTGISRYFVGSYLGASVVPDYVATFTALAMAQGVLSSIVGVTTPLQSQMWQAGNVELMRRYVFKLTRLSLGFLVMVYVFICIYGKEIFELWLGEGHFVGYPVLVTLAVMMLLEAHHSMLNTPCIAAERLQFYKYTLLGGLISVVLAAIMIPRLGLFGAVLAMLIAQMLTQNWIIPYISLRVLETNFRLLFFRIIGPVISIALSATVVGFAIRWSVPGVIIQTIIFLILLIAIAAFINRVFVLKIIKEKILS